MTWFARSSSRIEREALLDYWDEVIGRSPTTPVPPSTVPARLGAIVRSLHAAEAADPGEFAGEDRLLRALLKQQREISSMHATATTAVLSPSHPPRRATMPRIPALPIRPLAMPALRVGLVLLLLLATAAGIWLTGRNDNDLARLAALPVETPAADTFPDVPQLLGNPERTGAYPGPALEGAPAILWQASLGDEIDAPPALVDGILYVGAGDSGLMAIDAATGQTQWAHTGSGAVHGAPAVVGGMVYVTPDDGPFLALDAADGTVQWTFPGIEKVDPLLVPTPVVIDGMVYIEGIANEFYALDAATGERVWKTTLPALAHSASVAGNLVYFGTDDGVVHALNRTDGTAEWTWDSGIPGYIAMPAVAGDVVYAALGSPFSTGEAGFAVALDAATGEERWRLDAEVSDGFITPVIGEGVVYLGSIIEGMVHAIDAATGEERWAWAAGPNNLALPSLAGNTLYLATDRGLLVALNATTGAERWTMQLERVGVAAPVISGGVLFIGTIRGNFYAITGSESSLLPAASPQAATPAA